MVKRGVVRGRLSRAIVSCFCILVASVISVQAFSADLADIERRGVIRIAVPLDYPPFGTIAPNLSPIGYDIDTARYLADGLKLPLELVPVTSANRVAYLVSGRVDMVISSLGKTAERAQVIDFSTPYAPFFYGVFSASDEPMWPSVAVLAGKTIGATRGSLEELQLSAMAPSTTIIKRYEDNITTLAAFTSGQVDYIATGTPIAASLVQQGGARLPHPVLLLKNSPCAVGLRKEAPALRARTNALIEAGLQNGTFEAQSRRWFGVGLPADMQPAPPITTH